MARLLVLGATGGVGRQVVSQAIEAGHSVRALVRADDYVAPAGVAVVRGPLLEGDALVEAMHGIDAVLCSVGQQRRRPANPWSAAVSPPDLAARTAHRVVEAMRVTATPRVVAVSAAGVGDSADKLNLVMRFFLATTMIGAAYKDLAALERTLAESGVDWLCPRPTRLTSGRRTGRVRVTPAFGAMDAISRADVAGWMLDAVAEPSWPAPAWGGRTPQLTAG